MVQRQGFSKMEGVHVISEGVPFPELMITVTEGNLLLMNSLGLHVCRREPHPIHSLDCFQKLGQVFGQLYLYPIVAWIKESYCPCSTCDTLVIIRK